VPLVLPLVLLLTLVTFGSPLTLCAVTLTPVPFLHTPDAGPDALLPSALSPLPQTQTQTQNREISPRTQRHISTVIQPTIRVTIRHNLDRRIHSLQSRPGDLNTRHAEIAQALLCEGRAHNRVECTADRVPEADVHGYIRVDVAHG